MNIDLGSLTTEKRNQNTLNIDKLSTRKMVEVINQEDKKVAVAVEKVLDQIALAVDIISDAFENGGRLIYIGAGTSGRLGILDASECPPTYGVSYDLVVGLIAGGKEAIIKAKEGAEDSKSLAVEELDEINFSKQDVLVGIAASGRTPYVVGGLEYANSLGAQTISVSCSDNSVIAEVADVGIKVIVGPEVLTGSTRMKAGTAQKMVLNMLTTGAMIKIGKVYSNLMVDVKASNKKLVERAKRIVIEATGVSREEAIDKLELTDYDVKLAILLIKTGLSKEEVSKLLANNNGHISKVLEEINNN